MAKIEYAILFDLTKEFKPFGIWLVQGTSFDHYYADGYLEESEYFTESLEDLDLKGMDHKEFWNYWISQGGFRWMILGPFIEVFEKKMPEVGKEAIADLPAFIKGMKARGITANINP